MLNNRFRKKRQGIEVKKLPARISRYKNKTFFY